ncbi:MAG: GHKL domain-containing protein [Pirellulales bacterium]|nr:GHKL domain-containing protein [Pirellulales bacterium]
MITDDIRNWVHEKLWYQVPISISVIDRNFKVIEANPHFAENYGDWQGRYCYEVYKGLPERCENCAATKTFADGLVREREEYGVVRGGHQTHYLVHMVPLIGEDGKISHIVEMSTDITRVKLLEQEKIEAERLAAVGQTVAGLAHGVKNLLMGIDGGMYMLQSGIDRGDPERLVHGWEMLKEDMARMTSFVKEFLEFAKGRTPEVRLIDPNQIATDVFTLFRDTAALKGITISLKLQEGLACALMDEDEIHTCLANLVSNALDACEVSDKPNRNVVLSTTERDGILVFEVADDGVGIDYDIRKKIFSSFFSTKATGKGTGLGLLTTRKIVQEHGGHVSFDSTEGAGSVFRLEFPRDKLPKPTPAEEDTDS